ncbi:MAG TPA: TraB/GumN family protein, partial [Kofleriaceae bacterium]|nr:TraB/GumN family protein [Kofleriaceae bacterium]
WYELVDLLRGAVAQDALRHARPWYAMAKLTDTLAPSPEPAMDRALADRARARGLAIDHLETWTDQLAALDRSVGVADLEQAIHAHAEIACDRDRSRALYDAGDAATMTRLLRIPATDALVVERDRAWLAQLERYADGDGAFVAVGLAHLLGPGSLPELLAAAGYTVERVR